MPEGYEAGICVYRTVECGEVESDQHADEQQEVGEDECDTLLINHFIINKEWYLVDLPGYGYAKRSKKEVDKLDQMIRGYILQREQLVNVFVLVDIRLEPQKIDQEFIEWLGGSGIPFSIVFTKADKLTPNKARQAMEAYQKKLAETWEEMPPMFLTSAEKKEGREEVLEYIEAINASLL